jgi:hypothetical protein
VFCAVKSLICLLHRACLMMPDTIEDELRKIEVQMV